MHGPVISSSADPTTDSIQLPLAHLPISQKAHIEAPHDISFSACYRNNHVASAQTPTRHDARQESGLILPVPALYVFVSMASSLILRLPLAAMLMPFPDAHRHVASPPLHEPRPCAAYSQTLPLEDRWTRLSASSNQRHQPWACPTPFSTFSP